MSKPIHIDGEIRCTSGNRARRFIRDGRAEWTDATETEIRFVPDHHAARSVELNQHEKLLLATGRMYDRIRRPLKPVELRHIPFAGDIRKLFRA